MTVAKQKILDWVQSLPQEVEVEELMYRLYLLEKVGAAEEDIREGRVLTHEEAVRQAGTWRK